MELHEIEILLQKYDNGETTLKEEQQLRSYFAQNHVASHLEHYKIMFAYFNETKKELFTKDVPLKPSKNIIYKWISVAAVAIIMFTVFTQIDNTKTINDLNDDEILAYNQTMEILGMVSSQFNKGNSNLDALNKVSANFSKGAENITYMNQFSKTTNQFLKTTK